MIIQTGLYRHEQRLLFLISFVLLHHLFLRHRLLNFDVM